MGALWKAGGIVITFVKVRTLKVRLVPKFIFESKIDYICVLALATSFCDEPNNKKKDCL